MSCASFPRCNLYAFIFYSNQHLSTLVIVVHLQHICSTFQCDIPMLIHINHTLCKAIHNIPTASTSLHSQLLFAMAIAVYFNPPASLRYLAFLFSRSFFVFCISISRCAKCFICCAAKSVGQESQGNWGWHRDCMTNMSKWSTLCTHYVGYHTKSYLFPPTLPSSDHPVEMPEYHSPLLPSHHRIPPRTRPPRRYSRLRHLRRA